MARIFSYNAPAFKTDNRTRVHHGDAPVFENVQYAVYVRTGRRGASSDRRHHDEYILYRYQKRSARQSERHVDYIVFDNAAVHVPAVYAVENRRRGILINDFYWSQYEHK